MSCIYNDGCDNCTMYDTESHKGLTYQNSEYGFSVEVVGGCAVDGDDDPTSSCSMFEDAEGASHE